MAGEWIKVEKLTPDKPEIAILSRKLGVSLGEAFLSWFRVYAWADGTTSDGLVPHLSLSEGDTLARACPGTCAALASKEIQWISIRRIKGTDYIEFCNWTRHNGKSSKQRALDTEKKRRNRSPKCPDGNGTKTGPEKRREEYKKENNKKKENATFEPPTVEQVKAYCLERKNGIDPERFIAFYESKDWRVGKNKMANWKAAVITWEKNRPKVGQPLTDDELENYRPGDYEQ